MGVWWVGGNETENGHLSRYLTRKDQELRKDIEHKIRKIERLQSAKNHWMTKINQNEKECKERNHHLQVCACVGMIACVRACQSHINQRDVHCPCARRAPAFLLPTSAAFSFRPSSLQSRCPFSLSSLAAH